MKLNSTKLKINLGAFGWQHAHWLNGFYPEDLPEDWQLMYYSNEFSTVLVPASYWQTNSLSDCAEWIDNVHEDFRFFVECHVDMLAHLSMQTFSEVLQVLQPQLSALVFLDDKQQMSVQAKNDFIRLIDQSGVDVYSTGPWFDSDESVSVSGIWRNPASKASNFAFIENDLTDLRAARGLIEQFIASLETGEKNPEEATIIVNHPHLQAGYLSKFRAVLEVMGH